MESKIILVVDDDLCVRDMLTKLLTKLDYQVITAANGREAIDKAIETPPGLIIMDILLPDISGAEALQAIKDAHGLARVPAIFLSGIIQNSQSEEIPVINVGGYNYKSIAKPFVPEVLTAEIEKAFEND